MKQKRCKTHTNEITQNKNWALYRSLERTDKEENKLNKVG